MNIEVSLVCLDIIVHSMFYLLEKILKLMHINIFRDVLIFFLSTQSLLQSFTLLPEADLTKYTQPNALFQLVIKGCLLQLEKRVKPIPAIFSTEPVYEILLSNSPYSPISPASTIKTPLK